MLRNNPLGNTQTIKVIVGLGLCAIGGGMLFVYFKTRDDDDEQIVQRNKKSSNEMKKVQIELKINNEHVPLITGRDGANLKSIQEKTHTKIHFREKNNSQVLCIISGCADNVKEAHLLLLKEIERPPIVIEEIDLPQNVYGKIMGRCGEAMQEICRTSMAKVSMDIGVGDGHTRRLLISGNRQQVNVAVKLIADKIEEEENVRRVVDEMEQRREPRRSPVTNMSSSVCSSENSLTSNFTSRDKLMASKNEDSFMDVYVTAIATPSKFWVQLIGPQTKKLDDLVNAMTEYYSVRSNRDLHLIKEPYLGQIVATIFKHDSKWYRAEVVGILPNQYNPKELILDLYFVDYGDSEYVVPEDIFELRTDFLTLRFQAVECFLANVKSTMLNEPEVWEPKSIEAFAELTKVARWKKLTSRLVTYKDRVKASVGNAAAREGSPIPGIELYDVQDGVNLGYLLISNRYALPANDDDYVAASLFNVAPQNNSFTSNEALASSSPQHGILSYSDPNVVLQGQLQNLQQSYKHDQGLQENNVPSTISQTASGKMPTAQFLNANAGQPNSGLTAAQWQLNGNLSR